MPPSYVIYENQTTLERLEVKAPLACAIEVENLKREVGLPEYIDSRESFQIRKAITVIWASRNANMFTTTRPAISLALFGGAGFKLHCPSASPAGPFFRRVGDLDFVTLKEDAESLLQMMSNLHRVCGTAFFHAITSTDQMFNNLRAGSRYRFHGINDIADNGEPVPGLVDVLCDCLKFCHKIDVRNEIREAEKNFFTIGLENLIMSKSQYIRKVRKDQVPESERHRILGVYDSKNVIVGMENKDMIDVAAALLDHDIGNDLDEISVGRLQGKTKKDWKLCKTVSMNLANMMQLLYSLAKSRGIKEDQALIMKDRLSEILDGLGTEYTTRRSFLNKQWWEDVEDQRLG